MPKVLLIGWDGAGWHDIHPLLDAGVLPNLAGIVEKGVISDLAPLTPLCSPLLWTSIATGQLADCHGVLDTMESDPVTGGVRPITRASLTQTLLPDILAQNGIRSQSICWPVTHPAQGPATCVSDGFPHAAAASIFPTSLAAMLAPLRFRPHEWTGSELQMFVPELARIDQDKDKRLARLAVILAQTVTTHAVATTLLEAADHEFSAVWFGVVAAALELFPPKTDDVYKDVVGGVYRFLDMLLGRLLTLAGPEAITILLSDRTAGEPEWQASTGRGSRGILCATGPGIAHDELAFGVGLLDIAPTVLHLSVSPPAPGMAGRAISEICANSPSQPLRSVAASPPPASASQSDLESDLQELADLGYTDVVAAASRPETDAARLRRDFHLAQVLLAQDRPAEAIPLLERIVHEETARLDFRIYLAHAYRQGARYPECRALCQTLLSQHPDSPLAPLAWAHLAISEENYPEARRWLAAARGNFGIAAALDTAIGRPCLRTGNWVEAAAAFHSAIRADAGMPAAHEGLAQALLGGGHNNEAAGAALDAIRVRYDLPDSHRILGTALRALGREDAARSAFLVSEKLRRGTPAA